MVSGHRQRTTLDLTILARSWTHTLQGEVPKHNEFRPQGHQGNEQDLMAQFLYCRDVLRPHQSEDSSSTGQTPDYLRE